MRLLLALTLMILASAPSDAMTYRKPKRILPPTLPRCALEPPPPHACHKPSRYDVFTCACSINA